MAIEVKRVEETVLDRPITPLSVRKKGKKCVFLHDEICLAPKTLRFDLCRTCYRIDPRFIVQNFFGKIKALAILMLQGPQGK